MEYLNKRRKYFSQQEDHFTYTIHSSGHYQPRIAVQLAEAQICYKTLQLWWSNYKTFSEVKAHMPVFQECWRLLNYCPCDIDISKPLN